MPVPNGVDDVKKGSHKYSGHRSQDEVTKCILVGQHYHKEVLDGVQNGIERVLYPANCASELFLDTLLRVSVTDQVIQIAYQNQVEKRRVCLPVISV